MTEEQRDALSVMLSVIGLSGDPRVTKAHKVLRTMLAASADDAQPVAIYQVRMADEFDWLDVSEKIYSQRLQSPQKYDTRIVYATRDAAPSADREQWAVELINRAVEIMSPDQVGQWEGVRAFLETSGDAAPRVDAISDEETDALVLRILTELQSQFLWDAVTFESGPLSINKVDSRFTYFAKRLIAAASEPRDK